MDFHRIFLQNTSIRHPTTHLFPSVGSTGLDVCGVVLLDVEENEIQLRRQLGGGGENEGDGGEDHHEQRDEGVGLHDHCQSGLVEDENFLTWAAREVSGYSVRFHRYFLTLPYVVSPKSSSFSLSSYFC